MPSLIHAWEEPCLLLLNTLSSFVSHSPRLPIFKELTPHEVARGPPVLVETPTMSASTRLEKLFSLLRLQTVISTTIGLVAMGLTAVTKPKVT